MKEEIDNKEPGLSLARARQEKDLSLEDVAARLHLSENQIRLLEDNDYEDLPEATYIKGYIRNYAQYVGLEPVPLIAAYTERVNPKKNDTVELTASPQNSINAGDESKAMYAIAGIVVLVVAIAALWMGGQNKTENRAAQNTVDTAIESQSSSELFGPEVVVNTDNDSMIADESGADKKIDQSSQEPSYPDAPASAVKNNTQTIKPVNTEREQTAAIENEANKNVLEKPEITTVPDTNKQTAGDTEPSLPVDELVLFFEKNSWADVRDKNDKKLLYKTISEGRVVTVKGVAPFKIFLGNADGVRISYNGKQIDFEQYKRGLIARFTVGRN